MKQCNRCNVSKPLTAFSLHSNQTKTLRTTCRSCRRKVETIKKRALRIEAYKHFGEKCTDCGIKSSKNNYTIFDFHHLDPSKKDLKFSKTSSTEKFWNEIKKCIMLCSNCHRIRHFNERRLKDPESYK